MKNVGEVGKELCENTIVRKVTFTGSTAVAKLLYSMSASTMKKWVFVGVPGGPVDGFLVGFRLKQEGTHLSLSLTMLTSMPLLKVQPMDSN